MSRGRAILILLLAVPLASAAPVPKDVLKTEEGKLVGTWESIRVSSDGRDAVKQPAIRWTLAPGGKASASNNPSGFAYKLHPETDPKGFDLHWSNTVLRGLYRIDGDTLIVVTATEESEAGERPDELAPGDDRYYWEFKRVRSGDK